MSSQFKGQVEAKLLESETLDLAQYWQTIRRYLWRILSLAVLITILVALIVMSLTPQYKATATLLIESNQAKVLSIEEVYGLDSSRKEYFQTQYEILKSRQVAEKVVEKLRLYEHKTFDPEYVNNKSGAISEALDSVKQSLLKALPFLPQKDVVTLTEEQQLNMRKRYATSLFMSALEVSPLVNTQVVKISYEHESAKFAATIANAVGDVYIENYLQAKFLLSVY